MVVAGAKALVASNGLWRGVSLVASKNAKKSTTELDSAIRNLIISLTDSGLEYDIEESGNLPRGSGLGSSAAYFHAVVQAAARIAGAQLTHEETFEKVQSLEKIAHANPSGVDAMAVIRGGVLQFQKVDGQPVVTELKAKEIASIDFFLVDSGKPNETTADMVSYVKQAVERDSSTRASFNALTELSNVVSDSFAQGDVNLNWIENADAYLRDLGIVSAQASEILDGIQKSGGLAKITGAGGITGGSGYILAYHPDSEKMKAYLRSKSMRFFETSLGKKKAHS